VVFGQSLVGSETNPRNMIELTGHFRKLKEKVQVVYFEPPGNSWAQVFPGQGSISKAYILGKIDSGCNATMWGRLCGRLDYLRINFLLERLLTERGGASKKDLFDVSRELLDLTVFMWLERERWAIRQHDFDYIVGTTLQMWQDKLTMETDSVLLYAIDRRPLHRACQTS